MGTPDADLMPASPARPQRAAVSVQTTARGRRAVREVPLWVARHEPWITLGLSILLVFPNPLAPLALAAVPLVWGLRRLGLRRVALSTPLDPAILAMVLMVIVALCVTPLPGLAWVALCQIIGGVALFYALVNTVRTVKHVQRAGQALMLLGAALALAGALGTEWGQDKVFSPAGVYERLPHLLPETINANVLAGTLLMLIPFAVAVALHRQRESLPSWEDRLTTVLPYLCLGLMVPVFVLTQSRGAYVALVLALLVVALARFRWLIVAFPATLAAMALVAWQALGTERTMELIVGTGPPGGWERRLEIWQRAVAIIQDLPYTGIGLGTYGRVAPVLYPYYVPPPGADIPHAHNIFLQVGVDLGIPGLIAFVALLAGSLVMAWTAYHRCLGQGQAAPAGVALGLFAALVAMTIHGLVDAVTWGTKPAIVPWALMGLAAVVYRLRAASTGALGPPV